MKKILIVEDEESIRGFLKINLKMSNIVRNIFLAPDDFCNFS